MEGHLPCSTHTAEYSGPTGDTVEISAGGEILRVHEIKHDRTREHGAFANAGGRPSHINAA